MKIIIQTAVTIIIMLALYGAMHYQDSTVLGYH